MDWMSSQSPKRQRGIWFSLSLCASVVGHAFTLPPGEVRLGIDELIRANFEPLAGKRVGLITNPSGVAGDLRSTTDILHRAARVKLVALFGPEHGVRGDIYAGEKVADARDSVTGLPVFSLYGKTRKPAPEMLTGLDVLVYDVQDIGSRSYTFISTLALAMEAAAEAGVKVVVLDRPNPIGGVRVEGRPLDVKFRSFVGQLPIPYNHGMTVGELAQMINGEGWLAGGVKCDLTVVPMQGWRRAMIWADTGLNWVPTSPHIPRADSAFFYAATGTLGELHVLTEGVGYTQPFELCGGPGIEAEKLAAELNGRKFTGVYFRPAYFQPFYGRLEKKPCAGVQLVLTDPRKVELSVIPFHIIDAVSRLKPETKWFGNKRDDMFDKVCGTDGVRKMFLEKKSIEEILAFWREGAAEFAARRGKYLLYE